MRLPILLVSFALASACAAPHAVPVRCDRHLVPINVSGAPKAGESSKAESTPRSPVP